MKQINDLIKSNDGKERAIKNLEVEFNEFVNDCGCEEQDESDEELDTEKKKETKHPSMFKMLWNLLKMPMMTFSGERRQN